MAKTALWCLRLTLVCGVAIAAASQLYLVGGIPLLLVPTVWGASAEIGMENAIRNASNRARERPTSERTPIFGYVVFFGFLFLPAIGAALLAEWIICLAMAVLTICTVGLTATLCKLILGPWDLESGRSSTTV